MDIYINNQKENFIFDENIKIGKAIEIISSKLKVENKVICKLMIDNVVIPEENENEVFSFDLGYVKSLNLIVDSVDNLVLNGIESLKKLIPEIIEIINKTANFHRTGDEKAAKNLFSSSLEAMELVPEILNNVRSTMKLDFTKIKFGEKTFHDLEEGMLKAISSLFDAQRKEDYVTLADVLEYELVPNYSDWNLALGVIEKECKERILNR